MEAVPVVIMLKDEYLQLFIPGVISPSGFRLPPSEVRNSRGRTGTPPN